MPGALKLGGEFLVNASTADTQFDPVIARLANGNFVIVWVDGNEAGLARLSNIRAQIFNPDGSKSGGEILINTDTAGQQDQPTVAALAGGGFAVTWRDNDAADGNLAGIVARVFDANGSGTTSDFVVNTQTTNNQDLPVITGLATGGFAIAWQDWAGADPVRAQVLDGNGSPVGGEFAVSGTPNVGSEFEPVITTLGDGRFVVAWEDVVAAEYRAQVFNANGTASGSSFQVTDNAETSYAIAALSENRFIVLWDTGGDVVGRIRNADGSAVGGDFVITGSGVQRFPTVVGLADGRFVAAWVDNSPGSLGDTSAAGIVAQVFNADGSKFGGAFLVNTTILGSQLDPAITALGGNRFAVTWESGNDIYGQVFEAGASFSGTDQADQFIGTDADDVADGNDGNDWLYGLAGIDILLGGLGIDALFGGDGDDTVSGGGDGDSLDGGDGNDTLNGDAGVDWLLGGLGNDTLNGGDGTDALFGQDGNDIMNGEGGDDGLDGGIGNDTMSGGAGVDWLYGRAGDDVMSGGGETDSLFGEDDNDTLHGGDGGDSLDGGFGNDTLNGDAGVDWLFGSFGNDNLNGGADTDALFGQEGIDVLHGDGGGDSLDGGADNDQIFGDDGVDWLFGQAGDDLLDGGNDGDVLFAGADNDTLRGGDGGDSLDGGTGNDLLDGGAGIDVLWGDAGADTFFFSQPSDGGDVVRDFISGTDRIGIDGTGFGLGFTGSLPAAMFETGNGLPASFAASGPMFYFDTTGHGLWFDPTGGSSADVAIVAGFETGAPTVNDFVVS